VIHRGSLARSGHEEAAGVGPPTAIGHQALFDVDLTRLYGRGHDGRSAAGEKARRKVAGGDPAGSGGEVEQPSELAPGRAGRKRAGQDVP